MPRRMTRSHDELRLDAVDLAQAIVRAEGLSGLSVRRLATALGCSVGTIYNLFADLDDILLHVAARVLDDMAEALLGGELPEPGIERLVEIGRRYIRFATAEPRLWAMVFEHQPTHDRPTPPWQHERVARIVDGVRAAAAAAFPPTCAPADLAAAVEVLWPSVHGIAALGVKDKLGFVTGADPQALAERLVRLCVAGHR